jgi:hypothetical protein
MDKRGEGSIGFNQTHALLQDRNFLISQKDLRPKFKVRDDDDDDLPFSLFLPERRKLKPKKL